MLTVETGWTAEGAPCGRCGSVTKKLCKYPFHNFWNAAWIWEWILWFPAPNLYFHAPKHTPLPGFHQGSKDLSAEKRYLHICYLEKHLNTRLYLRYECHHQNWPQSPGHRPTPFPVGSSAAPWRLSWVSEGSSEKELARVWQVDNWRIHIFSKRTAQKQLLCNWCVFLFLYIKTFYCIGN